MKNVYMFFLIGVLIGAGVVGIYFNQQNAALQEKYVKLQEDYRKLEENYTALRENYEKFQANYTELLEVQEKYVKLQEDYRKLEENYTTLQENYTELSEVKIFKEILNAPCATNIIVSFQGAFLGLKECDGKLKIVMGREGKIAELPLSPNVIVFVYKGGQIKDLSLTDLKPGDDLAADALVAGEGEGILKTMDQIEIIRIRVFPIMSP